MSLAYRRILWLSTIIVVTVVIGVIHVSEKIVRENREWIESEGIEFVFYYGVKGGRGNPVNMLDTRNDSYVKDMVIDPPLKIQDTNITGANGRDSGKNE